MRMLVLGPDNPDARLNDFDFTGALGKYAGVTAFPLDPERAYQEGGLQGLEREVTRQLREHAIEVLVYALGTEFDFDPRFFGGIEGTYKILMLGDDEHYFDVLHRYYAPYFDLVLTTNPDCERYREYGSEPVFLPGVFDPRVFKPGNGRRKDYDVSFIGAMHGKVGRAEYARALSAAGIGLQLFGAGTAAGIATQEQVVEIYRRSRINLNFTGGALRTPLQRDVASNRQVRQLKGRSTKIALCGSFVLSEYAPGIDRMFDVGREIDVFRDEGELVEKVRFYLAHEAQREEMAARAHARALEQYDEAKFWPAFVQEVQRRAARPSARRAPRDAVLDGTFWSGFGAWRFKYFVLFVFTGRLGLLAREIGLLARVRRLNASAAVWFAALGLAAAERSSRLAAALRRAVRASRRLVRRTLGAHA